LLAPQTSPPICPVAGITTEHPARRKYVRPPPSVTVVLRGVKLKHKLEHKHKSH
jgi:hypothetical protein